MYVSLIFVKYYSHQNLTKYDEYVKIYIREIEIC